MGHRAEPRMRMDSYEASTPTSGWVDSKQWKKFLDQQDPHRDKTPPRKDSALYGRGNSFPANSKAAADPDGERVTLRDGRTEDRTRDWFCDKCGERNFARRFGCISCGNRRAMPHITDRSER